MNRFHRLICAVFALQCLMAGAAGAAFAQPTARPRIGLVLSGGGARGAAHVGVLKVLESNRIPIDYLACTSMGSIIGGMYASGMTPAEIEAFMLEVDWVDVFLDNPPRTDRSFRRKRDDDFYLVKAKLGVSGGKIRFPTGVLQGQKIDLLFKRYTLPAFAIRDFDELSTPFRAVTSDLTTGETVVLDSGDLARAIRASMSLPTVLATEEIDGRLLVDGGVSNNLPVDVARDMGADVVIAIDISTPLQTRDELNSVLTVTAQLISILTVRNTRIQIASLTEEDVFLQPELGDIETLTTGRAAEAIAIGERAAAAIVDELTPLSMSEAEYEAFLAGRRRDRTPPVIDEVKIVNDSRLADAAIAAMVSAVPGVRLDVDRMEKDLGEIYGLEIFESAYYDVTAEAGRNVLTVSVRDRSWGPNYLQFGLAMSGDFQGTNRFNAAVAYTRTAINRLGGEWRTALQIGQEPGAFTELYQLLDYRGRYFVQPRAWLNRESANAFDPDGNKLAEFRLTRYGVELAAGRNLGTWGEFRVGIAREAVESKIRVGDPGLPGSDSDTGEAFVQLHVDELDNLNFPHSGGRLRVRLSAAFEDLGSERDFEQGVLDGLYALTLGRYSGLFGLIYNTTVDDNAPVQNQFRLGGFTQLSGLVQGELAGQRAALLTGMFYRRLGDYDFLPVYAGFSLEYGNVFPNEAAMKIDNGILAGSVFAGLDTFIGPVYLAYGRAEGDRDNVYFFLGQLPRRDRLAEFRNP